MHHCRVIAPAKINLSLDITGRRHDGYHFLSMVMHAVALCDYLTLTKTATDAVELCCSCAYGDLPAGDDNLVVRAAKTFFARQEIMGAGVRIALQKEIPMQAGLAGGSADAAAVLVGLNALFDAGLDTHDLCEMGVTLGADVPFCIVGGAALAEGIGELLLPLPSLPKCHIVIAKPAVGVNTAEAFSRFDRSPVLTRPDNNLLAAAVAAGNLAEVGALMCNVFEKACPLPEVTEIKNTMLAQGALGAQMTGSGSAVFGLFADKSDAKHCFSRLKDRLEQVFLTAPCEHGAALQ